VGLQRSLREAEKRAYALLTDKQRQQRLLDHKQQQLDNASKRIEALQVRGGPQVASAPPPDCCWAAC